MKPKSYIIRSFLMLNFISVPKILKKDNQEPSGSNKIVVHPSTYHNYEWLFCRVVSNICTKIRTLFNFPKIEHSNSKIGTKKLYFSITLTKVLNILEPKKLTVSQFTVK